MSFGKQFGWRVFERFSNKAAAINVLKQLASAAHQYATTHDGQLPEVGLDGKDTWENTALPSADSVWYNSLPRQLNMKSLGDFVREDRRAAFYTTENVFFLPRANFPESKKMQRPYFPIAMNRLLSRRGPDGKRRMVKMSEIKFPARTVLFFERGLAGEKRAHQSISQGEYDGAPEGRPESFVARYNQRGLVVFVDGHVEEVSGKQLLTPSGNIEWSPAWIDDPSALLWTPDPHVDPNLKQTPP